MPNVKNVQVETTFSRAKILPSFYFLNSRCSRPVKVWSNREWKKNSRGNECKSISLTLWLLRLNQIISVIHRRLNCRRSRDVCSNNHSYWSCVLDLDSVNWTFIIVKSYIESVYLLFWFYLQKAAHIQRPCKTNWGCTDARSHKHLFKTRVEPKRRRKTYKTHACWREATREEKTTQHVSVSVDFNVHFDALTECLLSSLETMLLLAVLAPVRVCFPFKLHLRCAVFIFGVAFFFPRGFRFCRICWLVFISIWMESLGQSSETFDNS